jgi:uncharacterized protein (TIGR00297 family)
VTGRLRRAGAFAAVATLALSAPILESWIGPETAIPGVGSDPGAGLVIVVPFAAVALLASTVEEGAVFETFARPGDYEAGRLYGLLGFSLAATGLGLLTAVTGLPTTVFVGTVLLVGFGNLAAVVGESIRSDPFVRATAFVLGGGVAAVSGTAAAAVVLGTPADPLLEAVPRFVFLAICGGLLAVLLRSALFRQDDPLVMVSVGLLLWLLWSLTGIPGADAGVVVTAERVAVGLAVTLVLGYVSYALETASVAGMVTGVLLALITVVVGGYGWFAVLVSFYAVGSLATKYRYEAKRRRGVAEDNDGARGSGNVLGNAAVAIVATIAYAASHGDLLAIPAELFALAFAGSLATATSDTLSSEIGGLFDRPRLITTLEVVDPGTDGGVTWQGELAGVVGASLVAAISVVGVGVTAVGGAVVLVGGVAGMTVDSVLGATLEGDAIGNQAVNLLATLSGAVVAAAVGFVAVPF